MAENARGKKDNNSHDASSEAAFGTKATKTDAKAGTESQTCKFLRVGCRNTDQVQRSCFFARHLVLLDPAEAFWSNGLIHDSRRGLKALPKLGDEFPNVSNMNEPAKVSFRDQNVPWQAPASLRCHSGRDPANEMHRANRSNLVLDLASIDWNSGDKHMRSRRVQGHWGWTRPNAQIPSPPKKMKLRSIEFVV